MNDSEKPKLTFEKYLECLLKAMAALASAEGAAQLDLTPSITLPSGRVVTNRAQVAEFHDYSRSDLLEMAAMVSKLYLLAQATETRNITRTFPNKLELPPGIELGGHFYDPESVAHSVLDDAETYEMLCTFALEAGFDFGDVKRVSLAPACDLLFNFRDRLADALGVERPSELPGP